MITKDKGSGLGFRGGGQGAHTRELSSLQAGSEGCQVKAAQWEDVQNGYCFKLRRQQECHVQSPGCSVCAMTSRPAPLFMLAQPHGINKADFPSLSHGGQNPDNTWKHQVTCPRPQGLLDRAWMRHQASEFLVQGLSPTVWHKANTTRKDN